MSKIKTQTDSFFISNEGEWTSWDLNDGYSTGIIFTYKGMIYLYYQPESDDCPFSASARIIHNRKIYDLSTRQKVTKLGWIRIAKKWAKEVRAEK